MVSSISNNFGAGAMNILHGALNGAKPGEFRPKISAVTNIQTTLSQAGNNANERLIYSSALNRIEGIRQGLIEPNPNAEWEVVGAYLATTGQPFQIKVDNQGQLQVESQRESSLSEFSQAQKFGILNAIGSFEEVAQQVDLEETKAGFMAKYDHAFARLIQMEAHFPAEDKWEKDFHFLKDRGYPVQIGLDADGDLVALNQLEHDFSDIEDSDDRIKLLLARDQMKDILSGKTNATKIWQYTALGNKSGGEDYLLALDENGDIEIRNNQHRQDGETVKSLNHIIPNFLKEETELEITADWQIEAADLYRQRKAFYFDFDNSGTNIVVQELDLIHAMGLHKPVDRSAMITQAQLSILV